MSDSIQSSYQALRSMSASSSTSATRWGVFISFRGVDTRSGFTSHLYSALNRIGIRTFIDDPELRAGEVISSELLDAIKQSKIYIVVLSKNYASSSWCLVELVEILECLKSMPERLVIPIFYKTEPSVVRHQIGSFKEAFEKHNRRVAMETVNKWRATLKEVADLSGYHMSDEAGDCKELTHHGFELCKNRHFRTEAEIVNEVVDRVLLQINPGTLYVAKYPVGMDSHLRKINSLLDSGSTIDGVHCIGIHGLGGVGKTALAKAFYNQSFRSFDGSCFVANIKDICKASRGLESLQQQLIDDVLKCKSTDTTKNIKNIDNGINLIRERICSHKVLVILDDIDHRKQVDYLVGKFVAGSVVIFTTRNEDLLDAIGVKARYNVAVLGDAESRRLFAHHVFGDTEIKEEFMVMSEEILRHAGGLPLALTVCGSNLFEQPKAGWRWFIDRLQRVSIDADVEEKLMISFDALKLVDPILQTVFLDLACLCVNLDKNDAVDLLGRSYPSADYLIALLEKRSLITIDEYGNLSMHDLLREMGLKMVLSKSVMEMHRRFRSLLKYEDVNFNSLKLLELGDRLIEARRKQRSQNLRALAAGYHVRLCTPTRALTKHYTPTRALTRHYTPTIG